MDQDLYDRVRIAREGADIDRCHTVPHLRRYSVGQHTHSVIVLLYLLHPSPSPNLLKAATFHDVGERFAGDIPGQVYWQLSKAAADEIRAMEKRVVDRFAPEVLTEDEQNWLHACDKLELWLWTWEQLRLGNREVLGMRGQLDGWFSKRIAEDKMPKAVIHLMSWYRQDNERHEEVMA